MVKTGGENVASSEVEETIYLLSEVSEVAVFGVADPRWIEAVVAAVVPKPSASLTPEAVIAHCRSRLAGFKTTEARRRARQPAEEPERQAAQAGSA